MIASQIAVNMEAVQDRCDGTKQIIETLAGLKKWGIETVEILHRLNPDDGTSWRSLLDAAGMRACATHELLDEILIDPDFYIRKTQDLGCDCLSVGLAQSVVWEDLDSVKTLVKQLNELGAYALKAGVSLLYHNHNMEFAKPAADMNCLDYIFAETDPRFVSAELEAYWVQLSGMDAAKWATKLGKRLRALHLKDLCVTGGTYASYIKTPAPCVLGGGNMDIVGICEAAEAVGCKWYIIETHTNWVDGDSVKTAGLSAKYLRDRLCQ